MSKPFRNLHEEIKDALSPMTVNEARRPRGIKAGPKTDSPERKYKKYGNQNIRIDTTLTNTISDLMRRKINNHETGQFLTTNGIFLTTDDIPYRVINHQMGSDIISSGAEFTGKFSISSQARAAHAAEILNKLFYQSVDEAISKLEVNNKTIRTVTRRPTKFVQSDKSPLFTEGKKNSLASTKAKVLISGSEPPTVVNGEVIYKPNIPTGITDTGGRWIISYFMASDA